MNIGKKKSEVSEDEITRLFREVDLDGDGFISPKEAKKAFKKLSKLLKKEDDEVRTQALRTSCPCCSLYPKLGTRELPKSRSTCTLVRQFLNCLEFNHGF